MTVAEFIAIWRKVDLTERSGYQQHFLGLCRLLGHPEPVEADPTGESFTFERGAEKSAGGDGFADVWKKGFFGWEYKGRHRNLEAAYQQLLQYAQALENPPLLVVCDMERIVIRTNFTNTPVARHEVALADLARPERLALLRNVFFEPEKLKPGVTIQSITTEAARQLAEIAQSMRRRGLPAIEVAHFLDRMIFCLFAEDVGLLPKGLFSRVLKNSQDDPARFRKTVAQLFEAMAEGGLFGADKILHFNGNLFTDATVLEMEVEEIRKIAAISTLDWSAVDPSIFGTLFERGLDPDKRSQLGAHYTSREDIEVLVEPVVMQPLRREWAETRQICDNLLATGRKDPSNAARLPPAAAVLGVAQPPSVAAVPAVDTGNRAAVPLARSVAGNYRRRLPHLQAEGRTLFVTFCTADRWTIPEDLRAGVLACCLHDHRVKMHVHGVVVMPDHVHMVFTPMTDATGRTFGLAEILNGIKGASAHCINHALRRRGAVWQHESFDHILRSDESARAKVEYICGNPARRGLVPPGEAYRWLWREWVEGVASVSCVAQAPAVVGVVHEQERPQAGALAPQTERAQRRPSAAAMAKARNEAAGLVRRFLIDRLASVKVLDPACGSGNFLYVTLQKLKDLEKEVILYAARNNLGGFIPMVGPWQLYGIEINPYAYELAQMTVWIGYLQWVRDNGLGAVGEPVLRKLNNFQCKDAIMAGVAQPPPVAAVVAVAQPPSVAAVGVLPATNGSAESRPSAAEERQQPQAGALAPQTERPQAGALAPQQQRVEEPEWPKVDFIVGNPPFLGGKMLRRELGDEYMDRLFALWGGRVPAEADLCCYWFEKARAQIERGLCRRAGLLATQGIRGGANREALKRIKETGDIFFAESDREWVLDGASVHISMVGFDDGDEKQRMLDGKGVERVNINLTSMLDTTGASPLSANAGIAFQGPVRVGDFDVSEEEAVGILWEVNPHGRPNSDVVRPTLNGTDNAKRSRNRWVIDFGKMPFSVAALYERPIALVRERVKPLRDGSRDRQRRENWWLHGRTGDDVRSACSQHNRFIAMAQTAKFVLFRWHVTLVSPEQTLIVFARSDDAFFGVLHSRIHEVWALKLGTRLETRPRYTPTTCFETFPLPECVMGAAGGGGRCRCGATAPGCGRSFRDTHAAVCPDNGRRATTAATATTDASGGACATRTTDASGGACATVTAVIADAARELDALRNNWLNPPEWTKEEALEFPGSMDGPWAGYVVEPNEKGIGTVRYPRIVPRDAECAARLAKRTLTNLYNARPDWLKLAHERLDAAVAAAYGWDAGLSDEAIIERLLALNRERAG